MEYKPTSSSTNKTICVTSEQIKTLCNDVRTSKDKLIKELECFFHHFIQHFTKFENKLDNIIEFIIRIDTLQCKAYNAKKYNFCKPCIMESDKSFIEAKGLRHCLIEQLQTQELYVTMM